MCKAKRIRISEFIREHNFTKENLETFLAILKCGLPFLCFQDYKRYKELSSDFIASKKTKI